MRLSSRCTRRPACAGNHTEAVAVRAGRLLIECCVSLVLLAGASALVLLMSATTAHLVDDGRLRDVVQQETTRRLGTVLAAPCATTSTVAHVAIGPRVQLEVTTSAAGPQREVTAVARWQRSPLAGGRWQRHVVISGAWCELRGR